MYRFPMCWQELLSMKNMEVGSCPFGLNCPNFQFLKRTWSPDFPQLYFIRLDSKYYEYADAQDGTADIQTLIFQISSRSLALFPLANHIQYTGLRGKIDSVHRTLLFNILRECSLYMFHHYVFILCLNKSNHHRSHWYQLICLLPLLSSLPIMYLNHGSILGYLNCPVIQNR